MNIKASSSLTVLLASLALGDTSTFACGIVVLLGLDFSNRNLSFCNEFIAIVFGVTKDTLKRALLDVLTP